MSPKFTNSLKSKVSGVTFDDPKSGFKRQDIIRRLIRPGAKLQARLEPNNQHDPNAIALWFSKRAFVFFKAEYHIGYMTKTINERMAELLNEGKSIDVVVIEVTGGTKTEPTYGINIRVDY